MAVHFANSGLMELDVVRTMGVSIKTENAIGYFGTGLKYAIATLLRTDHVVKMIIGGVVYTFSTVKKEIRGKEFQFIMMNEEQLAFTTELGRDWQVWQAYRELYSNCLDEGGTVSSHPQVADTVISVFGSEIDDAHGERGKIFLHGEPWLILDGIEVHRGESEHLYYRGVRVHKLPKKTRFTYNFTVNMKLTEDRTLASVYDANYKLNTRLPMSTDPDFCSKILVPNKDRYEDDLDFSETYEPSEEFVNSIEKHMEDAQFKQSLKGLYKRKRKVVDEYQTFQPTEDEYDTIIRPACEMLWVVNCTAKPEELIFVENLGPNVHAMADGQQMRFTRQCLANGRDFLAITIYEEWIHNKFGYADHTRGMQQFLFDKILELIKR